MKDRLFIRCRCGETHPVRERETSCRFCQGPTWDHHAVCATCRGFERISVDVVERREQSG